jgi:hypothetical protein
MPPKPLLSRQLGKKCWELTTAEVPPQYRPILGIYLARLYFICTQGVGLFFGVIVHLVEKNIVMEFASADGAGFQQETLRIAAQPLKAAPFPVWLAPSQSPMLSGKHRAFEAKLLP